MNESEEIQEVSTKVDAADQMLAVMRAFVETSRSEYARSQRRLTFSGRRDIMQVLGYAEKPGYNDFWQRYLRQDVAGRIVDLPVDATWGGGRLMVEGWSGWEALERRLKLTARFTELDRLAGIGEFAVMLIGVRDEVEDGRVPGPEVLAQPVERLGSTEDIVFVRQYPRDKVQIKESVTDPTSERFGHPEFYEVDVASGFTTVGTSSTVATSTQQHRVHWSRILHVPSGQMQNEIAGIPRLMRVLDRMHDLDKVAGGSSEMFWQGADRAIVYKALSRVANTGEKKEDLKSAVEEFAHGLRRLLMVSNAEVDTLDSVQPDPSGLAEVLFTLISAGAGIPKRLLFGSERGELASTQDRNNFADTIANRRSTYAEPTIVIPFIDRLHGWGVAPPSESLTVVWPPIEILSVIERAELHNNQMGAIEKAERAAIAGGQVVAPEEMRAALGFEGPTPSQAIVGDVDINVDEGSADVQDQFSRRQG